MELRTIIGLLRPVVNFRSASWLRIQVHKGHKLAEWVWYEWKGTSCCRRLPAVVHWIRQNRVGFNCCCFQPASVIHDSELLLMITKYGWTSVQVQIFVTCELLQIHRWSLDFTTVKDQLFPCLFCFHFFFFFLSWVVKRLRDTHRLELLWPFSKENGQSLPRFLRPYYWEGFINRMRRHGEYTWWRLPTGGEHLLDSSKLVPRALSTWRMGEISGGGAEKPTRRYARGSQHRQGTHSAALWDFGVIFPRRHCNSRHRRSCRNYLRKPAQVPMGTVWHNMYDILSFSKILHTGRVPSAKVPRWKR